MGAPGHDAAVIGSAVGDHEFWVTENEYKILCENNCPKRIL
jgi:hypothetical protein